MSREILSRPTVKADVRLHYGDNEYQFGDLRRPAGSGPFRVVIGIHGGFWRAAYGLEYFGHVCDSLREAGFATWNIEYRRLGHSGGGWPGTFLDVAWAADYLRTIAQEYDLDVARVMSLGHSAGGQLAFWLAGRPRIAAGDALYVADPLILKAAVSLAGVLDLKRAWELHLSSNVTEELLGGTPGSAERRYASSSPYELLPLRVPQLIVHGTADEAVPYVLATRYHAAAVAAGDRARLLTFEGAGHFEMVDPHTPEWTQVRSAIKHMAVSE
jgi:acetyl esterase/lipase